jgi:predicted porin
MSAGYSRSNSDTANSGISTTNQNQQYNALIQYQVRKMGFTTGYARLEQGFGGSAGAPEILSSYYAGITRWFNFF